MPYVVAQRLNSGIIGTSPQSIAVTLPAGAQLVVDISGEGSETVTGVTWKGVEPLTLQATKRDSIGAATYKYSFVLANPTAGTDNVVVTWSAPPSGGGFVVVLVMTGGDNTTGFRAASTRNDSDGTGPGLTLANSQNGDIVFHGVGLIANTIVFPVGETVTSSTADNIAGSGFSAGVSTLAATGANTPVNAGSPTATDDVSFYCEYAFAGIPAAAADTLWAQSVM